MTTTRYRPGKAIREIAQRRRALVVSGPIPPPNYSNLLAYYEASLGTLDAGDLPADEFEKIKTWQDRIGSAHLVQATAGNQMRVRKSTVTPIVHSNHGEITTTVGMDQTTLSINKRASSFFALVEIDNLVTRVTSTAYTIMGLAGSAGDLCYYDGNTEPDSGVLYWRDGGGNTNTGIRVESSLALIGVILDASEIRLIYNDQTYTLGTPLSAGSVTGFQLLKGISGSLSIVGFNAAMWYDHALNSTELAAVRAWAVARKAVSNSAVSINIVGSGDSIAAGCFSNYGNLNQFRRYTVGRTDTTYRNIAFPGDTLTAQIGQAEGLCVGWPFPQPVQTAGAIHNPSNKQILWALSATNDVVTGTTAASMITTATTLRAVMKAYGYRVIWVEMTPWGSWTAPQLAKRDTFNAAMAALDSRQYGTYVSLPAALQDPTNTTYFNADQVHLTNAGFDVIYDACLPYLTALEAIPVSSLQNWLKFDGDFTDSSNYTRDWEAVGSPSFVSGLWGRQALRCTSGGNYARGKNNWREHDVIYWSCMFWMRYSPAGLSYPFGKYTGAAGTWLFTNWFDGSLKIQSNGLGECASSSTYFADGNWHCIAYSVDADGARLYGSPDHLPANLVLQATALGTPVVTSTANKFRVGANDDSGTSYNIDFQDVMTWFGSKTLAEFRAISVA